MEHYCCYLTLSISTLTIILPNNGKPKKGKNLTPENISPSAISIQPELSHLGLEDNRFDELLDMCPCLCPCLV